jgi:hypothetical protein
VQASLPGFNGGSVSCVSVSACIAVDFGGHTATWDGTSWTVRPTATGGASLGVACASATDCTAVGWTGEPKTFDQKPVAQHWNGSSWSQQNVPNPPDVPVSLVIGRCLQCLFAVKEQNTQFDGVACVPRGTCEAVGESFVRYAVGAPQHYEVVQFPFTIAYGREGNGWVPQSSTSLGGLSGVSCTSATACTAVGGSRESLNSTGNSQAVVQRWNGSGWVNQPTPKVPGGGVVALQGVSCTLVNACMAVGWWKTGFFFFSPNTLAESWNGNHWSVVPTP